MLTEELRKEALKIQNEVIQKANKVGLYYVICYWEVIEHLSYRIGYFEDINEAHSFASTLHHMYGRNFNFPFYIISNVDSIKYDGGLFDE